MPRGGSLMEMRFFVKDRLAATATEAPFRREVLVPVGDPESYLRVEAQLTDGRIAEDVLFLSRPGLTARIGVELVQLYVVATDRSGLPVRDLEAADFSVFEDDRAQDLESFRIAFDLPLTLGLAIDTSSSLFLRMPDVKRAATEFLDSLEPRRDRAFLVGFGTEPRLVRAATYNLKRGARRHRLAQAARPHRRLGRPVAVARPVGGSAGPQGLGRLLRRRRRGLRRRLPAEPGAGAARPGAGLPGADERRGARTDGRSFSTRTFVGKLERMAKAGGGRVYYVRHDQDLAPIFDSISRELRSHYLLTYYPKEEPGGPNWREVSVELERGDVVARTIEGRR